MPNDTTRWLTTSLDAWSLGMEASAVIGLRMLALSRGDAEAAREAALMVSEKVQSSIDVAVALMTGQLGATPVARSRTVIAHYRRKVRANRARLVRGARRR